MIKIKTGFNELDKIIDISKPQLILLTGATLADILSGDIANNICLKQECEVLEIIHTRKEYLIQRMLVNESNVNYRKWNQENRYTDEELKRIGKSLVNLVGVTKRLPTIIEQNINLYDLGKVAKFVSDYANDYADREIVNTLIVLDIFPLSEGFKGRFTKRDRKKIIQLIKKLKNISHKLRCPIIVVDSIDISKKFNKQTYTYNYIMKDDIDNINIINKYVDTFIILNENEKKQEKANLNMGIFDIDVYDKNKKVGTCKLKYDYECRKFLNK